MTAATNPDDQTITNPTTANPTPSPPRHGPILARMTDGNCLTLVGDAVSELPAAEWFEVVCADGKIVLTPIPSPPPGRRFDAAGRASQTPLHPFDAGATAGAGTHYQRGMVWGAASAGHYPRQAQRGWGAEHQAGRPCAGRIGPLSERAGMISDDVAFPGSGFAPVCAIIAAIP